MSNSIILAIIAIILFAILKINGIMKNVKLASLNKKDDVLKSKQDELTKDIAALKSEVSQGKGDQSLTSNQVEDFWNKK